MSTTSVIYTHRRAQALARLGDYLELTKPKIAALVLVTVAVAASLSATGPLDLWRLAHTLLGTALVASSASALNQWLERRSDAIMDRTAGRPLPSGRLCSAEVVIFGLITATLGMVYLALAVNVLTAALGLATWVTYVWIYTPLKSRTWLNTVVGAVAGALPVLMGAAAMGSLDLGVFALFMIVFLWQFPHFMAIAWIYRHQYAAAGLKMLPVVDPSGRRAGLQAVTASLALLPVSLVVLVLFPAGPLYWAMALVLGLLQVLCSVDFCRQLNESSARRLLGASLVYLPSIFLLLVLGTLG